MARVRELDVLSFAKLQAVLAALVGVLAGVVYSVGGLLYDIFTTGVNLGTALAFLALVGMPATFAAFGFALGIVEAVLYNRMVGRRGGVELRFR